MDEFVALARNSKGPAAGMTALMKQSAAQLGRRLVGSAAGGCWVGHVDSLPIPDEPILGAQVKGIEGHWHPQPWRRRGTRPHLKTEGWHPVSIAS
jgi:hypothetical protein